MDHLVVVWEDRDQDLEDLRVFPLDSRLVLDWLLLKVALAESVARLLPSFSDLRASQVLFPVLLQRPHPNRLLQARAQQPLRIWASPKASRTVTVSSCKECMCMIVE